MVVNLSMAVHALPLDMFAVFLVVEILVLKYNNWFTNFSGFIAIEEMIPS